VIGCIIAGIIPHALKKENKTKQKKAEAMRARQMQAQGFAQYQGPPPGYVGGFPGPQGFQGGQQQGFGGGHGYGGY